MMFFNMQWDVAFVLPEPVAVLLLELVKQVHPELVLVEDALCLAVEHDTRWEQPQDLAQHLLLLFDDLLASIVLFGLALTVNHDAGRDETAVNATHNALRNVSVVSQKYVHKVQRKNCKHSSYYANLCPPHYKYTYNDIE